MDDAWCPWVRHCTRRSKYNCAMEFRHLRSFVTVVECEGFTRAAERLAITQAGVSKHVAALEEEIGQPLLERSGRQWRPTAVGARLYSHARRVLDLIEEARRDLGMKRTIIEGPLRIAASTVPARSIVPELVAQFHELHPAVREVVIVSDSSIAIRAVCSGEADVGIVGELPDSSQLLSKPIAEDELVLVVSPQHPLAKSRKIGLAQLKRQAIIVREAGSGSRRCVERALDAGGCSASDMTVAMEMNSNEAILGAVERGVGAAFLSREVIAEALAEKRLVPVTVQGVKIRRHLFLISDAQRVLPAAGRSFLEFAGRWSRRPRTGGGC